MYNKFEDDIWESFLKAAVIENSLNELKDYPADNEINAIVIPERYDLKMRKLIKHHNYRIKAISILNFSRKIASIVIIFMGISFAFLLQYDEVRAACQKVIMETYDRYVKFSYSVDSNTEEPHINLNYIPDGFYLVESSTGESISFIIYENHQGDVIQLNYYTHKHSAYIDNEHYSISEVKIDNITGTFFSSQDSRFNNILCWNTDIYYILKSSLGKDEMIKIAKNLNNL